MNSIRVLGKNSSKTLLYKHLNLIINNRTARNIGFVPTVLSRLLKLRYLIFGTAVGGGVVIHNRYERFKNDLPDFAWLKDFLPEEAYDKLSDSIRSIYDVIEPPNMDYVSDQFGKFRNLAKNYFENLENAEPGLLILGASDADRSFVDEAGQFTGNIRLPFVNLKTGMSDNARKDLTDKERLTRLQDEVMNIQLKYQKELEKFEKENKELKKQLLLQREKARGNKVRKLKKSLIDMYSEVLDELSEYDSAYNIQDHLPRVVVIGDQSAGKTSVLEMIAQARIFPRGAGEMMTKSPVKVTLSEGPYHVASFKDSKREFDLTKESELAALRNEIELRMKNSVKNNQTISNEVISLSVKGPGLPRMVLVDLPGIISTETQGMVTQTKDSIIKLANAYMSNPNAIILCIQDGSIDAERSNVTDLVSKMDPNGKRTIFVLTKFDLAESNQFNPDRMKKILDGKLFPMKALGYFAVITGKGNSNDSIDNIRDYEEQFFTHSKLLRDGILLPNQVTTRNLSLAVSECFWKMVKESIEQQADTFKANRFNLETEWKNTFPRLRELDRDELYEKARGEILDEVINLAQIKSREWEEFLSKLLLQSSTSFVFNNIYMPASQTDSLGSFNTQVDIKLKQWADKELPKLCVNVGTQALLEEFEKLILREQNKKNHDNILDGLKLAIKKSAQTRHKWDEKALQSLRVIQFNALEDRSVPDKHSWDTAVSFMDSILKEKLNEVNNQIKELKGPSFKERWVNWSTVTPDQQARAATMNELDRLIKSFDKIKQTLEAEELTAVKKNLEAQKINVDIDFIKDTWTYVYKKNFLQKKINVCGDCKKFYFYYQRGFHDQGLECHDVVLFWRLKRMLDITCNALRQQIINIEVGRLEREVKEILDDFSQDEALKVELLKGKRVELAEELRRVRVIQEKLEEFIKSLNAEK